MVDSGDGGPPPLEDMTEQLERVKHRKKKLHENAQPVKDSVKASPSAHKVKRDGAASAASSAASSESGGFGGLKKGFLFGSNVRGKTSDSGSSKGCDSGGQGATLDDDVIRPKKQNAKSSDLEFPEVQEAMKEAFPFLNTKQWVTDGLLEKIEKDPTLSKAFQDPAMTQALTQFQANPQLALAAAKDKPEIQAFLQSFCALMGEHFTKLGEAEEKRELVSEIVSQEEAKMKEIISKPEVKRVLEDPAIRTLIETLKMNPMEGQRVFHSSSPDLKQKVRILIDNGLLSMTQ